MHLLQRLIRDLVRLFWINVEFVIGFNQYGNLKDVVSLFGGAMFREDHPLYQETVELGKALVEHKWSILTGGGPGLMEAANRGAFTKPWSSFGCSIVLPNEQKSNKFLHWFQKTKFFFTRKYMLISYSEAFVFMPGGYGTLDELFEVLTLVKTEKIPKRPIILIKQDYWKGMMDWIQNTLLAQGAINAHGFNLIQIVEKPAEVLQILADYRRTRGYPSLLISENPDPQKSGQQQPVNREYGE